MFNNVIIDKIRDRISILNDLKITINKDYFIPSDYDLINSLLINTAIADDRPDDLIIYHPTGTVYLLNLLITASFSALEKDLTSGDTELVKNLEIGEKIRLDGNLGYFQGIQEVGGEERIKVYCGGKGKETVFIRMQDQHRIQKYVGTAKILRGHKRKNKESSKHILSNILKLENNLFGIVRKSNIAILSEKSNFLEILKETRIQNKLFTHLFLTAKVPRADHLLTVAGPRTGEKHVVYLFSNVHTLDQFLKNGEKINMVIIDGVSKVKHSIISRFKDYELIENIIILAGYKDLYREKEFKQMGFKKWVWIGKDIKELRPIENKYYEGDNNNDTYTHFKTLKHVRKKDIETIDVDWPGDVEKKFETIYKTLFEIADYKRENENDERNILLRKGYGLLNYFRYIPFPLNYPFDNRSNNDKALYDPESEIGFMLQLINQFSYSGFFPDRIIENAKKMFECFDEMLGSFVKKNPKADIFTKTFMKQEGPLAVVLYKTWYVPFFIEWLKTASKDIFVCDVNTFNKNEGRKVFNRVIFTGWFGYRAESIFYNGMSDRYEILAYPFEKKYINHSKRKADYFGSLYRSLEERSYLMQIEKDLFDEDKAVAPVTDRYKDVDITDLIKDLDSRMSKEGIVARGREGEEKVPAKYILFEDGSYGYFTKHYKGKKLNRSESKIEAIELDKLETEDELVFIADSKVDIFDELVRIVEESGSVDKEINLAKLWKIALGKYILEKKVSAWEFSEDLKKVGCEKHPLTIENWIKNKRLIAPDDLENTLKGISLVTKDKTLEEKFGDIVKSCRKLYALHIKLGHYLSKCIIASIDPVQSVEIKGLLSEKVKQLSTHAKTAQIQMIGDDFQDVPYSIVNKVFEAE